MEGRIHGTGTERSLGDSVCRRIHYESTRTKRNGRSTANRMEGNTPYDFSRFTGMLEPKRTLLIRQTRPTHQKSQLTHPQSIAHPTREWRLRWSKAWRRM